MFLHLLYVLITISEDIKWLFIFKFLPVLVVSWGNRSTEFFTIPFWGKNQSYDIFKKESILLTIYKASIILTRESEDITKKENYILTFHISIYVNILHKILTNSVTYMKMLIDHD